jgi:actin-like ATPase involved in cell morphogenesis
MTLSNRGSDCAPLGLSIGASTLAAVIADRAVTGRPGANQGGLVEGFVGRVGDPIGIVAPDGSLHSAAELLAEALRELARTVTTGRPLPATVAVAYPGHWGRTAVQAVRGALRRLPPWSADSAHLTLLPDYVAVLAGLRADLPTGGIAAVCDFGGSATTITLVELATMDVIGIPLRHSDFSGEAIDRALLTHVLAVSGITPGATGTSAIAPLTRLRAECRAAKERLSGHTATTIPGRAAGLPGDIRLTRPELDELIREPLATVTTALMDLLCRNGLSPAELTAVVSAGGGAAIPSVTTTLSHQLRRPVITAPQPVLAAATGAALRAMGRGDENPTVITPADPTPVPVALAWSQATDVPELVPLQGQVKRTAAPVRRAQPRPVASGVASEPWYRRPLAIAAAALMVIAGAVGATALALRGDSGSPPASAPPVSAPTQEAGPPPASADPAPRTVIAVPAPAEPAAPAPAVVEIPLVAVETPPPSAVPVLPVIGIPPIPEIPALSEVIAVLPQLFPAS